jgi:hypothetical protein
MSRFAGKRLIGVAVAVAVLAGGAVAALADTGTPSSNATAPGTGIDEFGMTTAYYDHQVLDFTYTKGFFCDTSVASSASSGCEVGQTYNTPPAPNFDPLYITVPLGFSVPMNMQQCPSTLVCVDHPGTVDLTRLETTLKPLYPSLTDAQLTQALQNFAVPGHDHFITDTNQFQPEWWDVEVVGVTSPSTYAAIQQHQSFGYIQDLLNKKDPTVVGPVPSNLFLFFAVDQPSAGNQNGNSNQNGNRSNHGGADNYSSRGSDTNQNH